MERRGLAADKVTDLMAHLAGQAQLYGPVKAPGRRAPSFVKVSDPSQVVLDYKSTVLPPKRFFMPPVEELFSFKRSSFETTQPAEVVDGPKVLVGLHNYDAEAIFYLDYQMSRGVPDEGWSTRREGWSFVGVSYEPDDAHFGPSVGIGPDHRQGLDLFLDKAEGGYNVEILTDRGTELIEGFAGLTDKPLPNLPSPRFHNKLLPLYQDLPDLFERSYDSPVWKEHSRRCFSCSSCTMVCPTCYCFDVYDALELDLDEGHRVRRWDSCQVVPFTEVAGGEVFREKKESRVRHRIYRKFKYITDHFGKPFCVGCGRCIRACPAKISISEVVNDLARGAAS